MTVLCGSGCAALTKPPKSYRSNCDENKFRNYGYPHFGLIKCDIAVPDPTDLAQWAALCTSGDVVLSPKGKVVIGRPEAQAEIIDGCGAETVLESTYKLLFETYQATTFEDCKYFYDILKNHQNYRVFVFDCDGNVTLSKEYIKYIADVNSVPAVTPTPITGSPGLEFTISQIPHPEEGTGRKVKWTFEMSIRLSGNEMLCYQNVPGLLGALQC